MIIEKDSSSKYSNSIATRASAFVTYDLELTEISTKWQRLSAAIIEREIMCPLRRQVAWLCEKNIPVTIFVELGQAKIFSRYFTDIWNEIRFLLNDLIAKTDSAIGLHIHPNWDQRNGCHFTSGKIHFGPQSFDYIFENEAAIVSEWVCDFNQLIGIVPCAFRSGKYRPIEQGIINALLANGISIFSSSVQGSVIIADNGDVFDYSDIAEDLAIYESIHDGQTGWNIPVTARNGFALSVDYIGDHVFDAIIAAMSAQATQLCLVSHQKDISGDFFLSHCRNIEALVFHGYKYCSLTVSNVLHSARTGGRSKLTFDKDSVALLFLITQHSYITYDTITPFPLWCHRAIIDWQDSVKLDCSSRVPLRQIEVHRSLRNVHLTISNIEGNMRIVCPKLNSRHGRLRYYVRRILFFMPLSIRAYIRRNFTMKQSAWSSEINLSLMIGRFAIPENS